MAVTTMAQIEQRTTHFKADRVKRIGYRAGGGGRDHYCSDRAEDYTHQDTWVWVGWAGG